MTLGIDTKQSVPPCPKHLRLEFVSCSTHQQPPPIYGQRRSTLNVGLRGAAFQRSTLEFRGSFMDFVERRKQRVRVPRLLPIDQNVIHDKKWWIERISERSQDPKKKSMTKSDNNHVDGRKCCANIMRFRNMFLLNFLFHFLWEEINEEMLPQDFHVGQDRRFRANVGSPSPFLPVPNCCPDAARKVSRQTSVINTHHYTLNPERSKNVKFFGQPA